MANGLLQSVVRFIRTIGASQGGDASDGSLLRRFTAERDEAAFTALMRRHGPMVFGVCRRVLRDPHDAEDAFQATFLVLVRKAGSVGRPDLLGNWLYGVARRTALKAKTEAAKRRAKERRAALPAAVDSADPAGGDLAAVLDEEVSRLPVKYRAPFVLCYLEGKTNEEAARLLGCPAGTVASRLAWARERLRSRLTRRGLGPSAGMLPAPSALTSVPPNLAGSTAKAAMLVAAGQAATGAATSANVAALTEGMMKAMFVTKMITAAGVLLAVSVLAAGALFAYPSLTVGTKEAKEPDAPKATNKPEPEPVKTVSGLSARIEVKSKVPLETKEVEAELVLTNEGDKPLRVCTLFGSYPAGPTKYEFRAGWFKSDRPTAEQFEKRIVTLQPGKSVSLPFTLNDVDRTKDAYTISAAYEVEEEFAKAHDAWKGRPEAEVTVPVKKAEGPMSLEFQKEVPPSALKIVLTPEAKGTRSDKKLVLAVKVTNESSDEITATLAHEWHGGLWPPTGLYASVAPADAKEQRPFVPAYLVGEDPSITRETAVAPGKAATVDTRMDWPGTGSVHGTPLMEPGRQYKVRLLLVFKAGGRQQYVMSSTTEVEMPSE